MKTLALVAFGGISLSGCMLIPRGAAVEIINASDYDLEIAVHTKPMTFTVDGSQTDRLKPTKSARVYLPGTETIHTSISFKAWRRGRFIGAIADSQSFYLYQPSATTIIIRNEDFQQRRWPW